MKTAFSRTNPTTDPTAEALKIGLAFDAGSIDLFGPLGPPAYESYKAAPPVIWPPKPRA